MRLWLAALALSLTGCRSAAVIPVDILVRPKVELGVEPIQGSGSSLNEPLLYGMAGAVTLLVCFWLFRPKPQSKA